MPSGWEARFKMSDGKYKTTKERLIKARERRTNRQNEGGDEEYSKCIVKEFKETESLRQRANYTDWKGKT